MKYCPKCGTQLEDEAMFCSKCGAKQEAELESKVEIKPIVKTKPKRNVYDTLGLVGMIIAICMLYGGSLFILIPTFGGIINLVIGGVCLTFCILGIINAAGKAKCIVGTAISSIVIIFYLLVVLGLAAINVIVR